MSELQRGFDGDGEGERLPWLEPVDDYDEEQGLTLIRLIGAVIVGLIALGLVVSGIYWLRNRDSAEVGDGELITAPEDPYKELPEDSGGMQVEGTGDVAYGASTGNQVSSSIDLSALPEAPVTDRGSVAAPEAIVPKPIPPRPQVAAPQPAAPARTQSAAIQPAPARPVPPKPVPPKAVVPATVKPAPVKVAVAQPVKPPAPKPVPARPVPPKAVMPPPAPAPVATTLSGSGGAGVQLGAFSSPASASKAWSSLSGRFGYLAGMEHVVAPVSVGGRTLYRLRVKTSGGPAAMLCSKLKVAGESCVVVN